MSSDSGSDTSSSSDSESITPSTVDVEEPLLLPNTATGQQLQRMILIDGFNIMHFFKDMGLEDPVINDEKMCPLILVPLLSEFVQNGFNVRVVLRNMPDIKKASDIFVLEFLQDNDLILYNKEDDTEKDDLLLLELAKQYGAIIISNDFFRNHKGYEEVAANYRVEYSKDPTGYFGNKNKKSRVLKDGMIFKYIADLHEEPNKFYANSSDEDYDRVVESHQRFKKITFEDITSFKILNMYIYCSWCYIFGYDVPHCASAFIDDDAFPMSFYQFRSACFGFEEKEKKRNDQYHGYYDAIATVDKKRKKEDSIGSISETDLNPYLDDDELDKEN